MESIAMESVYCNPKSKINPSMIPGVAKYGGLIMPHFFPVHMHAPSHYLVLRILPPGHLRNVWWALEPAESVFQCS